MSNRLKDEKSPYLIQHKDNPVDWYPWCEEAFRKAEEQNKDLSLKKIEKDKEDEGEEETVSEDGQAAE